MQSSRVFALSLLSGLIAAAILVAINMTVVKPYTNMLADTKIEELMADGEFDEEEFELQMQSIYASQLLIGPIAIGIGAGALVGGAYIFSRFLTEPFKMALLISGIAWFVLYVVPTVKYPPNPQVLFDPEAASLYYILLAGYSSVSGLSALGIAAGFTKIRQRSGKVFGAAALYLAIVSAAFFAFPDFQQQPQQEDTSGDLAAFPQPILSAWRAAMAAAMTAFWFGLGLSCGLLWSYGGGGSNKSESVTSK